MKTDIKERKPYKALFAAALVLFLVQLSILPSFLAATYATRSEKPEHVLTYSGGSLEWDRTTETDKSGAARLSFFDSSYQNVASSNSDKVIAPGTDSSSIVRLVNSASGSIGYTAVAYAVKSDDRLPLEEKMECTDGEDTGSYTLPEGIDPSSVIRAVSGRLDGGRMTELDIKWVWDFEDGDKTAARDLLDTYLGDAAAEDRAENVTVGVYIVVEDGGEAVTPRPPQTGDAVYIIIYVLITAAAAALAVLFGVLKRRRGTEE